MIRDGNMDLPKEMKIKIKRFLIILLTLTDNLFKLKVTEYNGA